MARLLLRLVTACIIAFVYAVVPWQAGPTVAGGDSAQFKGDTNYGDRSIVIAGRTVQKGWYLLNNGSTTWSGYEAVRISSHEVADNGSDPPDVLRDVDFGPLAFSVPTVAPWQTGLVSTNIRVPDQPGRYRVTYQLRGPGGLFGPQFWMDVIAAPTLQQLVDAHFGPGVVNLQCAAPWGDSVCNETYSTMFPAGRYDVTALYRMSGPGSQLNLRYFLPGDPNGTVVFGEDKLFYDFSQVTARIDVTQIFGLSLWVKSLATGCPSDICHWSSNPDPLYSVGDAQDHFKVFNGPSAGFIVAIEDSKGLGDADFDDLVLYLRPVNSVPTANPGGPYPVEEGGATTLTGSGSDPDGDPLTYAWDLDNNGTFETPGQNVTFSAAGRDGPGSQTVALQVCDEHGACDARGTSVSIVNVPPTLTPPASQPNNEGAPKDYALGSFTDPGPDSRWSVDVDWGDGKPHTTFSVTTTSPLPQQSHTYADNNHDNSPYTVTVKVTDKDGGSDTRTFAAPVANVPPTVNTPTLDPAPSDEGDAVTATAVFTDPALDEDKEYACTVDYGDGSVVQNGTINGYTCTGQQHIYVDNKPGDAAYTTTVRVIDKDGAIGSNSALHVVKNVAPEIRNLAIDPAVINENDIATLSGEIVDPGVLDSFTLTINWGDGSTMEVIPPSVLPAGTTSFSVRHQYLDDNPTGTPSDRNAVQVTIQDKDGGVGTASTSVTANNLNPALTITAPAEGSLYPLSTATVDLASSFTDVGTRDTHTCTINWDDGSSNDGRVIEDNGSGSCTGSHTYAEAGVYTISVTVADDDTGSDTKTVMVVVYDPQGGFVTGGGWIESPAGAYKADPSLTGKASFGFVSKYQKGATVPTGQTEFQFRAGSLNFHSDTYEYLVIAGAKAQYKGTGTINGVPGYKFLLTATDGDQPGGNGFDKFRIKIANPDGLVYDNAPAATDDIDQIDPQAISGGSIVIHTK